MELEKNTGSVPEVPSRQRREQKRAEKAEQKARRNEEKEARRNEEKEARRAEKSAAKAQRRMEKYDKRTRQEQAALEAPPLGKRPRGRLYTIGEEIFNAITHGAGAVLSIAALVIMTVAAVRSGSGVKFASALVYGLTLIVLYTMSTLYHSIANRTAKKVLQVFDHCTIYLLIAGTYTPYTLVTLQGKLGWTIFAAIWGLAALGVILNAIDMKKFRVFSTILYPLMGWAIIAAFRPLAAALPPAGIWLLVAGGVAYTLGLIFYGLKKHRYMHSVWHLFVMAGSVLHFLSVMLYVL